MLATGSELCLRAEDRILSSLEGDEIAASGDTKPTLLRKKVQYPFLYKNILFKRQFKNKNSVQHHGFPFFPPISVNGQSLENMVHWRQVPGAILLALRVPQGSASPSTLATATATVLLLLPAASGSVCLAKEKAKVCPHGDGNMQGEVIAQPELS